MCYYSFTAVPPLIVLFYKLNEWIVSFSSINWYSTFGQIFALKILFNSNLNKNCFRFKQNLCFCCKVLLLRLHKKFLILIITVFKKAIFAWVLFKLSEILNLMIFVKEFVTESDFDRMKRLKLHFIVTLR